MPNIWMLSPFTTDGSGNVYPTCSAYTNGWTYPMQPLPATTGTPASTIAHVQSATKLTTATNTHSATASFGVASTPGNLIIVSIQRLSLDYANLTAVTDTGGNTYTQAGSTSSISGYKIDTFYSIAGLAATSVTVTSNSSSSLYSVTIHEYSGVSPLQSVDDSANTSIGLGQGNVSFPIHTTVAGELVFAEAGYNAAGSDDPYEALDNFSSTYAQRSTGLLSYTHWLVAAADKISPGGESAMVINTNPPHGGTGQIVYSVTTFLPVPAVPGNPGLGLVYCQASDTQIAAAQADPTITVCSANLQTPIPASVLASYAYHGAINNMSLAALLTELGRIAPSFLLDDPSLLTTPPSVPFYSAQLPVAGTGVAHSSTNGITITPFVLPYGVLFSTISVTQSGTDATYLHSLAIFDTSGDLIVSSTPAVFPASGLFPVAFTYLPAGMYYAAWTCNGATAIQVGSLAVQVPTGFTTGTATVSSGAVMPANIIPPAATIRTPATAQVMAFSLF